MFLVLKPLMGNSNFKDQMISESQKQGNSVSTSELNQGIDVLGSFFSFLTGSLNFTNFSNYWRYF